MPAVGTLCKIRVPLREDTTSIKCINVHVNMYIDILNVDVSKLIHV